MYRTLILVVGVVVVGAIIAYHAMVPAEETRVLFGAAGYSKKGTVVRGGTFASDIFDRANATSSYFLLEFDADVRPARIVVSADDSDDGVSWTRFKEYPFLLEGYEKEERGFFFEYSDKKYFRVNVEMPESTGNVLLKAK